MTKKSESIRCEPVIICIPHTDTTDEVHVSHTVYECVVCRRRRRRENFQSTDVIIVTQFKCKGKCNASE